ncbi:hypothetical protein [Gordonia amicalis]|uniref:hypothetical protein n=1 Tax=Gordonia amicalis TaxID=89053 RepID=UPI0002A6313B|nr:hypothetical protein [Gordonia amicalis]MDJ0452743.1 hypothetical protein [Gordonia amicalis]MDV7075347.1 hypothetical protein [Gordonia amicalis]NKX76492.1 hypothetical protein [Gordonia amicalis]GAC51488.1 hypothetical protein GOAMI_01_01940 [Gordonia amicalis NBRC 100051 = JCM 11271]
MVRVLYFRLLLTVLVSTVLCLAVFSPATASPPDEPDTHRITITFTSDRQLNGAAVWFDADGRLRTQTDVPLAHQDGPTKLWSATLVYTRPSPREPLDALFQSSGTFSRCEIRVDSVLVADDMVRGPHPTSRCRPRN